MSISFKMQLNKFFPKRCRHQGVHLGCNSSSSKEINHRRQVACRLVQFHPVAIHPAVLSTLREVVPALRVKRKPKIHITGKMDLLKGGQMNR